ncbi:MAG: lipase maturation factor family protein, partial [Verrucomicrobiota bacterium]|nr:lipase maturation factor family protein [Verrucomicrobiota bacterium]
FPMAAPPRHVANPPAKPLLLFDGDCHFCRRWVERWREETGAAVDYATSAEAGGRFPEIPAGDFQRAVQLVTPDGRVLSGAAAVFESLGHARGRGWLTWSYRHVPGFAMVTELAYKGVAQNRMLASKATRLLWGNDVRQPTYFVTRDLFLRGLGLIFLAAFVSLWTQVDGLIGSGGILPVGEFLAAARAQLGAAAPLMLPTLCWFGWSNDALHLLCGLGAALSIMLTAGFLPALSLLGLFACYLSLTIAGQTFLGFQWDILLLETAFLAIFFAPWRWHLRADASGGSSRVGLFLLKLLLFKLMFMSGVVKLTSGDSSWWDLTALNYHYETQPLPTVFGWWAHQAPAWFQQLSTLFVLGVEVVTPFLIWAPRRLRLLGFALLVALQLLILLTGNYAFFNLLTILLSLLLLDDAMLPRRRRSGGRGTSSATIRWWAAIACAVVLLPVNASLIYSAFAPSAEPPQFIGTVAAVIEPLRIANGYGLFRVMTKERREITLEGSRDGEEWLPYEFRWKPGPLREAPRWVAPHQPRLDWQMWFAALGNYRQNRWFLQLSARLLENAPDVVALLKMNPFEDKPPRYVRARVARYRFTSVAERRASGNWWTAEESAEYLPAISLRSE